MKRYRSMDSILAANRRQFLKGLGVCTVASGGVVLGVAPAFGEEQEGGPRSEVPSRPETNIDDFMKVPRAAGAIPGPFPGRVVQIIDPRSMKDDVVDAKVVRGMVDDGIGRLAGVGSDEAFQMLFTTDDVVGLKVNPVGPPLINTRHELVDAMIRWLVDGGLPKKNIVIWDRFDMMLSDAGYTAENFPGVRIEALQTMDEEGDTWRTADGRHVSEDNFDRDAYYLAKGVVGKGVRGYKDDEFYLNQHVFAGEYSYFGKLVTRDLTKIVNLPVLKNTGNGISVATKNLGYGALCNTGRLHVPLFFDVCTEVLAAPWVRDKLVLNITDGLRGQYDGGPMKNAQFVYPHHSLYFATDPFALDMVCHEHILAKRKEMEVKVNEHPRFTEYLRYAERLELGVTDPAKIDHVKVERG
jgi:hypothetical protein